MAGACLVYAAAAGLPAGFAIAVILLAALAHAFAEVLSQAGGWGLSFELADPVRAGTYQGVFGMGYSLGAMVSPLFVTSTALTLGLGGWAILAGVFLVSGLGTWAIARRAAAAADGQAASGRAVPARATPGGQRLLEPVVGVDLVVERRHLHVARRAVHRDRLGEARVRLERDRSRAVLGGRPLERLEDAAPDAHSAHLVGDPHPLDVRGLVVVEQHRAATDGAPVQAGEQEAAVRLRELARVGVKALLRVEAARETAGELVVVRGEARAGIARRDIRRFDLDEAAPRAAASPFPSPRPAAPAAAALSGASRDAARSSLRRSSSARSARPASVGRAVRTRESAADASSPTSPSRSSDAEQPAEVARVELRAARGSRARRRPRRAPPTARARRRASERCRGTRLRARRCAR